jgi:hypothetical protein
MIKIDAYITVRIDGEPRDEKIPIEPHRILFEDSCMVLGFKPLIIDRDDNAVVRAITVNGITVDQGDYEVEAGWEFVPGMKQYYPSYIAQCGKQSP